MSTVIAESQLAWFATCTDASLLAKNVADYINHSENRTPEKRSAILAAFARLLGDVAMDAKALKSFEAVEKFLPLGADSGSGLAPAITKTSSLSRHSSHALRALSND